MAMKGIEGAMPRLSSAAMGQHVFFTLLQSVDPQTATRELMERLVELSMFTAEHYTSMIAAREALLERREESLAESLGTAAPGGGVGVDAGAGFPSWRATPLKRTS